MRHVPPARREAFTGGRRLRRGLGAISTLPEGMSYPFGAGRDASTPGTGACIGFDCPRQGARLADLSCLTVKQTVREQGRPASPTGWVGRLAPAGHCSMLTHVRVTRCLDRVPVTGPAHSLSRTWLVRNSWNGAVATVGVRSSKRPARHRRTSIRTGRRRWRSGMVLCRDHHADHPGRPRRPRRCPRHEDRATASTFTRLRETTGRRCQLPGHPGRPPQSTMEQI